MNKITYLSLALFTLFIVINSHTINGIETRKIVASQKDECDNINALNPAGMCRCLLKMTKAGGDFCAQRPELPGCSISEDVRGVCSFIAGKDANDWTAGFLDRVLTITGTRDEFYRILTFMAKGTGDISDISYDFIDKWHEFLSYWRKAMSGNQREASTLGCPCPWDILCANCVAQNMQDPLCGYINNQPRQEGSECSKTIIDCHELDPVRYFEGCTAEQAFSCIHIKYSIGSDPFLSCRGPFPNQLCDTACLNEGQSNCEITEYRAVGDCQKISGIYDSGLNLIDDPSIGCSNVIMINLQKRESDEGAYDPNDPKQMTNGHCVVKYWEGPIPYCGGSTLCYPLCYSDTAGNTCCPTLSTETGSWTGNAVWNNYDGGTYKGDCSKCDLGQIQVCETPCQLEPVYLCSSIQDESQETQDSYSCPYIYSATSTGYSFEEDIIVSQIFGFMKGPYYSKLNRYDPKQGKILVYEHLDETSYLDKIALKMVEHPQGTEILVDPKGVIHTIKNPEKVKCKDSSKKDCTSLIENQDAKISVAARQTEFGSLEYVRLIDYSSYGKEAWNQEYLQGTDNLEYMELEFPSHENKKTAKLVIAFSHSGRSEEGENRLSKILIAPFLKLSEISGHAKEIYKDINYRRVKIQYLEKGKWKDYPDKEIYNLHGEPYKKTVIPLDLGIIRENKIRILQRGSFVYDYIAVDYSENEILAEQKIPLQNYPELESEDKKELILEKEGYAMLEFEKTEPSGENAFSFILESTGYYVPKGR